jgi:hypothetical protein
MLETAIDSVGRGCLVLDAEVGSVRAGDVGTLARG